MLPFVALKVKVQAFLWQKHVEKVYYRNEVFRVVDQKLLQCYQTDSPYAISKRFMLARGCDHIHVYGETPLAVYDALAKRWGIRAHHRFVELGAGRGRGLLFLASIYGCECVGIEWILEFVLSSKGLHSNVHMYHDDFLKTAHLQGDFIYLYGTCLEDEEIVALCKRFLLLPRESKIITVSFPLREYDEKFLTVDEFEAVFPWGRGTIYLNTRSG